MTDETFMAALSALSGVRPNDVDFEDPRDVASLRALSFMQAAADMGEERGYGFARRVVDVAAPRAIREIYPHSDAQHLFIMAWAATCERTNGSVTPAHVSWLNISILHLIDRVVSGDCHAQCDHGGTCNATDSCELRQLYRTYATSNRTIMPLDRFLLDLSCPDQRDFVRSFYDALERAPQHAIERSEQRTTPATRPDSADENAYRHDGVMADEPPSAKTFAFPFLNPITNKRRWIVGARLTPWNGVRLRLPAPSTLAPDDAEIPESYDLFGVWHVNEKKDDEPLTKDDFIAVQGAFVPSDMRERLYDTTVDAAAAARNMSHNLGSHAISHIVAQLAAQPIDPAEIGLFLRYLQQRASLIAVLASGARWPFSVSHSLKAIITDFNAQSLLLANLCLSEGCAVGQVQFRGNDVDVELPGSAASRHAIFAILENFARNSALHSRRAVRQVDLVVEANELTDRIDCKVWDANANEIEDEKLHSVTAALSGVRMNQPTGLGASDMRTWAKFAEMVGSEKVVTHGVRVDKSGPKRQLALTFSLRRSQLIADPSASDASTARLVLYRCQDDAAFDEPSTAPGRWIKVRRRDRGVEIRTRFGRFTSDDHRWQKLYASSALDESVAIEALAAYLATLRRFVYQTELPKRDLALFIRDGRMDRKVSLPFDHILAQLEPERERPVDPTTKDEPFRLFNVGHRHHDFAIWERHNRMLDDIAEQRGAPHLVHYEHYEGESHPYRQLLDGVSLTKPSGVLLWGFLAETALMRGVVLDERLANEQVALGDVRRRRQFLGGVEILNPFSEADMDRLRKPTIPRSNEIRTEYLRPTFVSVHSSLARNRFASNGEWNKLLDELKALYPIVTVHSGGGASPKALGLPFHELSLFGQWVSGMPCKLFITEAMARSARGRETWR